VTVATLFELEDDAGRLDAASAAWSDVATALDDADDTVDSGARSVRAAGWEGATAESYDAHRKQLVAGLETASTVAGRIAATLAAVAGTVRIAQGRLDLEWAKVAGIPHAGDRDGGLVFETESDADRTRVDAAITAAGQIRDDLDRTLAADAATLRECTASWQQISADWGAVAAGDSDPFDLPVDRAATGVITDGDTTIVNAGGGDDTVRLTRDLLTGQTVLLVNGRRYVLPEGQHVVIRGGGGNDTIELPGSAGLRLTVSGSDGDDRITGGGGSEKLLGLDGDDEIDAGGGDDRVVGGAGRDYLDGQDGDDHVEGGLGDDTLYGLDGDDTLLGGEGQDYQEGGAGDDRLVGGAGDDVLSGGRGDDAISGGAGDDVAYAGTGSDVVEGGSGHDTAHLEDGDTGRGVEQQVTVEVPDTTYFFRIEGSPEFVARVEADIDMLRSSPAGQQMLADLQSGQEGTGFLGLDKDTLTIREYDNPQDPNNSTAHNDGHGNYEIDYNTRIDHLRTPGGEVQGPPSVVLYHELAHVYDYLNGTSFPGDYQGDDTLNHGTENDERQAAGLPIDHDSDPDTPERIDPDHPYPLTENGLRDEMGVPHRDHY